MIASAINEYEKRLGAHYLIEWVFPSISTTESEGAAILKQVKDGDTVFLLDERGKSYGSPEFAALIDKEQQEGTKRLVLIIGGAFGVSEEVKKRANITLSLSKMVFPHMLVRLILVEQIYRAMTILEGGKYHHE